MGILLSLIIFINLLLGTLVLSQNINSLSHRLFFLLCLSAIIWTTTSYMSMVTTSIYWLRGTYALGSLLVSIGLIWTLAFLDRNLDSRRTLFLLIIALFFSGYSFLPGFITTLNANIKLGAEFPHGIGWGLPLYLFFYMVISSLVIFNLWTAHRRTISFMRQQQIKWVLIGAFITLSISALSSFILPLFSVFLFAGIDNIGFLIFLILVVYSIFRYHLFDIRVVIVKFITFGLWLILLMRIMLSTDYHELMIEGGIFVISLILGLLFIRSILQSIEQREKIDDLTSSSGWEK